MAQFVANWMTFSLAAVVIVAASAFLPLGLITEGTWIAAVGLGIGTYTGRSIVKKITESKRG